MRPAKGKIATPSKNKWRAPLEWLGSRPRKRLRFHPFAAMWLTMFKNSGFFALRGARCHALHSDHHEDRHRSNNSRTPGNEAATTCGHTRGRRRGLNHITMATARKRGGFTAAMSRISGVHWIRRCRLHWGIRLSRPKLSIPTQGGNGCPNGRGGLLRKVDVGRWSHPGAK